jgi:hypothetical protein
MTTGVDPRAAALAALLRQRAAFFSLSADVNDSPHIAGAGMSLLEAAEIAEQLTSKDQLMVEFSEHGMFESMPDGQARVVATADFHRALQRSIVGHPRDGLAVLQDLLKALPRGRTG